MPTMTTPVTIPTAGITYAEVNPPSLDTRFVLAVSVGLAYGSFSPSSGTRIFVVSLPGGDGIEDATPSIGSVRSGDGIDVGGLAILVDGASVSSLEISLNGVGSNVIVRMGTIVGEAGREVGDDDDELSESKYENEYEKEYCTSTDRPKNVSIKNSSFSGIDDSGFWLSKRFLINLSIGFGSASKE